MMDATKRTGPKCTGPKWAPKFTSFTQTDIRKAAAGIQKYVACYSDPLYPDEMLSTGQTRDLLLAVSALNRYLGSEGMHPERLRAPDGSLLCPGL